MIPQPFAPIVPPSPPDLPGRGIALSAQAERRIRTLRRATLTISHESAWFRFRPHSDLLFVQVRRLSAEGGPVETPADHLVSDTACDCAIARRYAPDPCIHRRALQSLGGIPGFYSRLAAQLHNPALVRCRLCQSLLDGHYDDLGRACCLDCETGGIQDTLQETPCA